MPTYAYVFIFTICLYDHSIIIVHRQDIINRTSWGPQQRQRRSNFPGIIYIYYIYDTLTLAHIYTRARKRIIYLLYYNILI